MTAQCALHMGAGCSENFREALTIYPWLIFSRFLKGFDPINPMNVHIKFEKIAIEVLGRVANLQSWGRGGRRWSWIVPFERALVSSYRPSIVTFPLRSKS